MWWIIWYEIIAGINHSIIPFGSIFQFFSSAIFFSAWYWEPIPEKASKTLIVL
ncbi:MAG: hypothetical protein ACRCRP_03140 [Metamycoplasmataceae bacterium]